jgi:hypothetical protein
MSNDGWKYITLQYDLTAGRNEFSEHGVRVLRLRESDPLGHAAHNQTNRNVAVLVDDVRVFHEVSSVALGV